MLAIGDDGSSSILGGRCAREERLRKRDLQIEHVRCCGSATAHAEDANSNAQEIIHSQNDIGYAEWARRKSGGVGGENALER